MNRCCTHTYIHILYMCVYSTYENKSKVSSLWVVFPVQNQMYHSLLEQLFSFSQEMVRDTYPYYFTKMLFFNILLIPWFSRENSSFHIMRK
jgi:hypothetical protein